MTDSIAAALGGVLIADDDGDICRLIQTLLSRSRIPTEVVYGGRAALACAERQHYALVIIDVCMGDMSGLDVCRAMKADPAFHAPILLMSCGDSTAQVAACYEAGADDFLSKPFKSQELLARVGRLIEANSAQHRLHAAATTGPYGWAGSSRPCMSSVAMLGG
ncbi:response regulator transcription factor [Jatrophihabitans sp.]|uniref:response regulator transcription factor n=1 Tax=Jatrophihabitans sp. TaxID=1932789 RepID=UPI0030C77997|nr:transcriptional regulatory, terminal family protein [Jatrophihabitans sp.]